LEKRIELENYYEKNNIGLVNFKNVKRAPHILSITLNEIEADEFLMLKAKDFTASTGSACNSSVISESHVLLALNHKNKNIIRISIY
jgi:cysteine desulfurase